MLSDWSGTYGWRHLHRKGMSERAHLMCWALKAGATPLRTAFQCLSVWPVSMFVPIRNCKYNLCSAHNSHRERRRCT